MADTRKIFPIEKVMELASGKKGADVKDIASFLLGCPVTDETECRAAAPFATAWLARWHPRFAELEWQEGQNWESFVKQARAKFGEHMSLLPMSGRLKELAADVLNSLKDARNSLLRQTDAAARLEEQVRELKPFETVAKAIQKKNDELEAKLKAMKADMGALQRRVNEFQGKLAIDNDGLMQSIKDAIRDGLKGIVIGAASGAGAEAESGAAPAAPARPVSEEDEWTTTPDSGKDDEWG